MPNLPFKERRQSDRIEMVLPIRVQGIDASGNRFDEETETSQVALRGVKLGLKTSLQPTQEIPIRIVHKNVEAPFRVIGQVPGPEGALIYWGAECLDSTPDIWGIEFPPIEEGRESTARLLLQCVQCSSQNMFYLSDLEAEVFSLTKRLHHRCITGSDWTDWADPESVEHLPGEPAHPPWKVPRAHPRIELGMRACVLTREGEEEIVETANNSAGGLAVLSKKNYETGSLLKVAFPYQEGKGNIFLLARIIRVAPTDVSEVVLYGIQYVR